MTSTQALKAAKNLTGQYAHLRPDNPQVFVASVGAILAKYPLGVVEECCDPRGGIALSVEFLSLKSLGEWCDAKLANYQALAGYVPPPPPRQIEPGPVTAEQIGALLKEVADQLRASNSRSPLDMLINQRAGMRRESVERARLYADRIAPKETAP